MISPELPIASAGPLSGAIGLLGFFAVVAWLLWRFGPTLARLAGWSSMFVAWACGSQGGYGCCAAFAVFGVLAWGAGTAWYARRRGYWPSALSARLFTRLLGRHAQLAPTKPPDEAPLAPHRRR